MNYINKKSNFYSSDLFSEMWIYFVISELVTEPLNKDDIVYSAFWSRLEAEIED